MRVSGTKPSSVIFSQTKEIKKPNKVIWKSLSDVPKVPKKKKNWS